MKIGTTHNNPTLYFIQIKRAALFALAIVFMSLTALAQTPQAFKYQAVARNASGQIMANQAVSFRISILQGSISGTTVYSETHTATTNAFGLVNLEIGNGTLGSGSFSAINWGAIAYFIQIEMDPTGGANYQLMGTSQLLSVPYALHAGNGSKKYKVGDAAQGGIVFWVDESGEHGLVVTTEDVSTGIAWSNGVDRVTNTSAPNGTGDGVYAGFMKTMLIVALQTNDNPNGNFAAKACADLIVEDANGIKYGDWYLPSITEWKLLDPSPDPAFAGIPSQTYYWSSSEAEDDKSAAFQRWTGEGWDLSDKNNMNRVRAIRKF